MKSEYMIYTPEGKLFEIEDYHFKKGSDLECLVNKEVFSKSQNEGSVPAHISAIKKFGINWEEMSDSGHMRFQPKAALIFDLISQYAWDKVEAINVPTYPIKGTNMFNINEKAVNEHAKLFGDRLYKIIDKDNEYILRYAACHQQFAAIKHWNINYKHLPFGAYENADSYRLEQSGELLLCFRTRRMNMPDLHIFSKDIEESKDITLKVHKEIYNEFENNLGRELVDLYNITESFFDSNKEYMDKLLEIEKKPVLLNFVPENKYYWAINVEHHIVDNVRTPREIGTFQIDLGNSKRFDITYKDKQNESHNMPIIHTAMIGTIERYLYTLFDTAYLKSKKGKPQHLPLWVSPNQVRIIPVNDNHTDFATDIANQLNKEMIRTDVDDRSKSVSKKIAMAEKDWVNYTMVVGNNEINSNKFNIRNRHEQKLENMTLEELTTSINKELGNKPRIKSYVPVKLSMQPTFV